MSRIEQSASEKYAIIQEISLRNIGVKARLTAFVCQEEKKQEGRKNGLSLSLMRLY